MIQEKNDNVLIGHIDNLQSQIDSLSATIGWGGLNTTAQNLIDAINENRSNINNNYTSLNNKFNNYQLATIGAKKYIWNATVQGVTWCRIFFLPVNIGVEGSSGILSLSCTRGNVVSNAIIGIVTGHPSKCWLSQLGANSYTSFQIRGVANSTGDCYIEIYDSGYNATTSTRQVWHCVYIPLLGENITTYTSLTTSSIPSGYTANSSLTINVSGGVVKSHS